MLNYIIRRFFWMVPTLMGILLINFAILRMQDTSLSQEATGSGSETGGIDREAGFVSESAIRSHIARFARTGRNLPAIINLRGFADKDDIVELLRRSEFGPDRQATKARQAQDRLWLGSDQYVAPLAAVLRDDELQELHAPASLAFSFTAYTPLIPENIDHLSKKRLSELRIRNARLEKLAIDFINHGIQGFVVTDSDPEAKRQDLLEWYDKHAAEYEHGTGDALAAMFLRTGFMDFFYKLFTGNLYSETRQAYVFSLIAERWQVTFGFTLASIIIAWSISILVGVRSARRRGHLDDQMTTTGLFMLYAMPEFFVGTLLLYHLCADVPAGLNWFPNRGLPGDDSFWMSTPRYLMDVLFHAAVPLVVLSYNSFTALSRYMRGNVLDQLGSDYIRTARAKGCDEKRIVYKHALRNSLITMITLGSTLLAALFGGFIYVELIFSIPGLGLLLLDAARQNDAPLIMGSTIISVLLLLVSILIADLLYAVVDPRIRSRYA